MLRPILYLLLIPALILFRAILLLARPGTRFRTTPAHEAGVVVFWLYLLTLGYFTVNIARILRGQFEPATNYNLNLFSEIRDMIVAGSPAYAALNILGNVLLFIPFGFFLPLLWKPWGNGVRVVLAGAACSGAIEVLQFFTGRSADVDDIFLNTVGTLVGYLGYRVVCLLIPKTAASFRRRPFKERQGKGDAVSSKARHRGASIAFAACLMGCVILSGSILLHAALPLRVFANRDRPEAALEEPAAAEPEPYTLDSRGLRIYSESIILLSLADNSVIYEVNADQRIYPASMTKIMTTFVALENLPDLNEQIFLREEIFPELYTANASMAGFLPGEIVEAIDLLYGVMLPSGAECSMALAEHIAGSEPAFVELMNQKAVQIGLENTHFVNTTGLHHENHYSTVDDIARLLEYALENPQFQKIFVTDRYSISRTNLHPDGMTLYSMMLRDADSTGILDSAVLGGKTGYTDEAGQCLASIAEIDGNKFLLVTAGARPEDRKTQNLHIEDAVAVYGAIR